MWPSDLVEAGLPYPLECSSMGVKVLTQKRTVIITTVLCLNSATWFSLIETNRAERLKKYLGCTLYRFGPESPKNRVQIMIEFNIFDYN